MQANAAASVSLGVMTDEPLSAGQLDELEGLAARATAGPWTVFAGPGIGGDDFIRLGGDNDALPDMYVRHDAEPAPVEDLDFIAAARNYVPRLIAEIRRHGRE
jgi:hypothetical protein